MAELSVDIYSAGLAKTSIGPLRPFSAEYSFELDRIGGFALTFPAEEELVAQVAVGHVIYLYHEGEGLVYRGIVDMIEIEVSESGEYISKVSGSSIARQLVWLNTFLGRAFEGVTPASAVATLLTGTGWASITGASANLLTARFDGVSKWAALERVAQVFDFHLRENPLTRTVTLDTLGTVLTTLHAANIPQVAPELGSGQEIVPIAGVRVIKDAADIWNVVVPLGAGEGVDQLSLRYSTRTTPHVIWNAVGPDGRTYYYIQSSSSNRVAYGTRQTVLAFKDVIPLANSDAGFEAGANALYDIASSWLTRHMSPLVEYEIDVPAMQHVSGVTYRFQVGDKIRVSYQGITTDLEAKRRWLNINTDLWITAMARSWDESGADTWKLTVATIDRRPEDEAAILGAAVQGIRAIEVAPRPYTYREIHNLGRTSIDTGKTAQLTVTFDGNVAYMHQAKLTFVVRALRSNVTVAGSSASSNPTSNPSSASSSGASTAATSGGGSPHQHTITGGTAADNGSHSHQLFQDLGATPATRQTGGEASHTHGTHAHRSIDWPVVFGSSVNNETDTSSVPVGSTHDHAVNVRNYRGKSSGGANIDFMLVDPAGVSGDIYTFAAATAHGHTLTGISSVDESTHSHGIAHTHNIAHTHTVDIQSHTHPLTYGIYDNPSGIGSPAITLVINGTDRTTALGGPWNPAAGAETTLDISTYLTAANGQPLRQSNTIVFGASTLVDIEATVRSLVTATSLVPV